MRRPQLKPRVRRTGPEAFGCAVAHFWYATPGEHTLVSRVTDVTGKVQPTAEELESKKTFLEDNSQFPRKVMIS
ncbi:MAG: hypothetical protein HYS05_02695 [Acidobacteria bacterium]|nr:hypothetical protein [Acidobacteriota bacterium]